MHETAGLALAMVARYGHGTRRRKLWERIAGAIAAERRRQAAPSETLPNRPNNRWTSSRARRGPAGPSAMDCRPAGRRGREFALVVLGRAGRGRLRGQLDRAHQARSERDGGRLSTARTEGRRRTASRAEDGFGRHPRPAGCSCPTAPATCAAIHSRACRRTRNVPSWWARDRRRARARSAGPARGRTREAVSFRASGPVQAFGGHGSKPRAGGVVQPPPNHAESRGRPSPNLKTRWFTSREKITRP